MTKLVCALGKKTGIESCESCCDRDSCEIFLKYKNVLEEPIPERVFAARLKSRKGPRTMMYYRYK